MPERRVYSGCGLSWLCLFRLSTTGQGSISTVEGPDKRVKANHDQQLEPRQRDDDKTVENLHHEDKAIYGQMRHLRSLVLLRLFVGMQGEYKIGAVKVRYQMQ